LSLKEKDSCRRTHRHHLRVSQIGNGQNAAQADINVILDLSSHFVAEPPSQFGEKPIPVSNALVVLKTQNSPRGIVKGFDSE
jgi:hypothetical protein